MFCVAATPTPAQAWAQRAATAGEEEEITIPKAPVSGQRARSEKVMAKFLPAGPRGRFAPGPPEDISPG